eukprot:gene21871-8648_t
MDHFGSTPVRAGGLPLSPVLGTDSAPTGLGDSFPMELGEQDFRAEHVFTSGDAPHSPLPWRPSPTMRLLGGKLPPARGCLGDVEWVASWGKSGARFATSADGRYLLKSLTDGEARKLLEL